MCVHSANSHDFILCINLFFWCGLADEEESGKGEKRKREADDDDDDDDEDDD